MFYSLFLIDTEAAIAAPLCPFVKSGEMHRMFHYNRVSSDGGIDYVHQRTGGPGTPYAVRVKEYLRKVYKKRVIQYADAKNIGALRFAVDCAKRVGLESVHPKLLKRAERVLSL
jgi:hypothetical protein